MNKFIPRSVLCMIGEKPIVSIYQDIVLGKIAENGISSEYESIKKMIVKLEDLRSQTILHEILEEQYYPVCIDRDVVIILFSQERMPYINDFDVIYMDMLENPLDLNDIIIEPSLTPKILVYLLSLWFTQIYNRNLKIFFGTDDDFITKFNKKLASWGFDHELMPLFPVMLLIGDD